MGRCGPTGSEKVIALEQQTWVNLLGLSGFGLALMGYLATMKRDLKADISGARAESRADIAGARAEFRADIGRIDSRLATLESRTYDISARLPPAPASSSGQ